MATVLLPSSIDHTGASNVSASIKSFLQGLAAGTVCQFQPNGLYLAAIQVGGLTNIEIDLNGATVQAPSGGFSELYSPFWFQTFPGSNSGVRLHNGTLIGTSPSPGTYIGGQEAQHGVLADGGSGFEFDHLTIKAVYGDGIMWNSGASGIDHDNQILTPGRVGVSYIWCNGVHSYNENITHPGYMPFDVEPNLSSSGPCQNIEIGPGNQTAFWSNAWMAINGSNTTYPCHDISVHDNVSTGKSLLFIVTGSAERCFNISVLSNRSNVAAAGPVLQFSNVDGLTVQHNIQPLSSGVLVSAPGSTGPGGGAPIIAPNNDTGAVLAGTATLVSTAAATLAIPGLSGAAAAFMGGAADLTGGGPGGGSGGGTTSRVHNSSANSASTASLAVTIPLPTLGNTLIVPILNNSGGASIASGQGGVTTWQHVVSAGFYEGLDLWYGVVDGTPSTTVTITCPTARIVARVIEYSGHLTLDASHVANGSSATIDPGAILPAAANELVLAFGGGFSASGFGAASGGFTDLGTVASASFQLGVAELIETTAVSADSTWSQTAGGWDAGIAAFSVVGGAAAGAVLAGTAVLQLAATAAFAPTGLAGTAALVSSVAAAAMVSVAPTPVPAALRAVIVPNAGTPLTAAGSYPVLAFKTLAITSQFWGGDSFLMTIGGAAAGASALAIGALLWLPDQANSVFVVEQIETNKTGASKANSTLTVSGRSVDGFIGAERLVIPLAGLDYDEQAGLAAETVMKHYVRSHAGINAPAARQIPNLVVAPDLGRGPATTIEGRFQFVGDVLLQVGMQAGYGWSTTLDPTTGKLIFDVIVPTDRSASVIFDFAFETITAWDDVDSALSSATLAVVAGQGDLAARDVETRFVSSEPTGFDRREAFIDARDVAQGDLATLDARGDAFLEANGPTRSVAATIYQFGSFQPGRDWFLGDLVLLHDLASGVNEVDRVVKLVKTYSSSIAAPVIVASVGKPFPGVPATQAAPSGGAADAGVTALGVSTSVKQVLADLSVGGANLVKNSSFESAIAGLWTADPAWDVPYTAFGIFGLASARIQLAGQIAGDLVVSSLIAVSPLDDYWISFWSYLQAFSLGVARFEVREYDASAVLLATTPVDLSNVELIPTRHALHFGVDATTPERIAWQPTTSQIAVAFYTPTTSTLTWMLDGIQVERGAVMTAYAPAPQELIDGQVGTTQIADDAITTEKLIAEAVDAGRIAAGAITADKLAATLILVSLLKTANDGSRVELDAGGFRSYSATDDILVNIPTDGVSPVAVAGQIRATSLLVPGPAEFDGATVLAKQSATTLAAGVLPPALPPVLASGWATQTLAVPPVPFGSYSPAGMSGGYYDANGGASGSTPCYVALAAFTAPILPNGALSYIFQMIEWKIADGSIDRTTTLTGPYPNGGLSSAADGSMVWFGVTRIGASWYAAGTEIVSGQAVGRVTKITRATGAQVATATRSTGSPEFRDIKTDGAVLLVLDAFNRAIQTWTTGLAFSSSKALTGAAGTFAMTSFEYDGTLWWIGTQNAAVLRAYAFTPSTGANVANRDFPLAPGAQPRSLFWDGANLKSVPYINPATAQTIYTHSAWDWTTASALYWCGYSWYDDIGTAHETAIGARASILMDRRMQLTVSTPAIPAGAGGGSGTTSLVQKADNQSASTSALVVTLPGPTTLGNTVVVAVLNNGGFVSSITGGGVGTWAHAAQSGVNEPTELWWGVVNGTPSAAVTINVAAASRVDAKAMEFVGALSVDLTNTSSGTSTTVASGSVTPTQANDLVVAAGSAFVGAGGITAGPTGGFTDQGTNNGVSGTFGLGVGTLIETSIVAASATWTAAASTGWDGVIVAFKVPAAAAEDPDKVRVYMLPNATAPAPGAFWLQATDALTTRILTSYTGSGTHDGAGTAFPGGVGATLASADGVSVVVQGNGVVHLGGSSFPSSPATDDHYYRADLHLWFYFDGTRWVSEQLFKALLGGSGPAGSLSATTNSFGWAPMDYLGGSDVWLVDASAAFFVNTGGTALGASHNWVVTVAKMIDSATTLTTVATLTLNSGANGNRVVKAALGALTGAIDGLQANVAKTGTPGAIFLGVEVLYRIVAT